MKAVITTGTGGYDKLDYRDVPVPVPGPGEVLLRVLGAGVNNTEINTRLGWYSASVKSGTGQFSADNPRFTTEDGGWNAPPLFPLSREPTAAGK